MQIIGAAILILFVSSVYGHGILLCPQARPGMGVGFGAKQSPRPPTTEILNSCRGIAAGNITATYQAGARIPITWQTTLYHPFSPGVRIAVSYNENDTFNNNVLVNGVDAGQEGTHTYYVTLPQGKVCDNCIIQWIWDSQMDGGYYLECADIRIIATQAELPSCAETEVTSGQMSLTSGELTTSVIQDENSLSSSASSLLIGIFLIVILFYFI